MRVVVNHLTRMDAPRICVAAIAPDTGKHVRPTTDRGNPLTRALLAENGGPLALGTLIELGETTPTPEPPQTEDCLFRPDGMQVIGRLSPNRYLELLRQHAQHRVLAIFGDELERHGRSYAVEKGCGAASLGILRTHRAPDLKVDRFGKLRLHLKDASPSAFLPVTDVRFVEADHKSIRSDVVADVSARMQRGVQVLLMVGLARGFQRSEDDSERHWLQVNGICMADRPLGDQP
ncbi:MAG TPA: hypothetical protein VMD79_11240 [Solirubrobacteraceae bacterium]|nr:hypothetical protein [Solirubrobacteraceae bacterium]